jgi:hypothetical protein
MKSHGKPRVRLHHVDLHYHDLACYTSALERVERNRDRMLDKLAQWTGMSVAEVVQFIGGLTSGAGTGRTFDEQLDATYGYAHIEILHAKEAAA